MARREVRVGITTTADTKGVDKAALSFEKLEADIKEAQDALKGADVGSKQFQKLNAQLAKTKEALKNIKAGKVDDKGLAQLQRRLGTLRERTQRLKQELAKPPRTQWVDKLKGKLEGLNGTLAGTLTKWLAIGATIKQGFGTNAAVESLTTSFDTLLGSVEAAEGRIESIRELAASTPLSFEGLASANRLLEQLSGGALATADGMRLVGDAAAVAQQPMQSLDASIQNVALHIGRLFTSLSSGKGEIGESTLRLQELGLITPELSHKLRSLHKEGTRGAEAWGLLEASLRKFSGQMEKQSRTLAGRTSTLKDAWAQLTATVTKPFVPAVKGGILALTVTLNTLNDALGGMLRFLGFIPQKAKSAASGTKEAVEEIKDVIQDLNAAAEKGAEAAAASIDKLKGNYETLSETVARNLDQAEELNKLQMDIALARIEADEGLSPIEKERRKAKVRDAAGVKSAELAEKALIREMEINAQRLRDQAEAIGVVEDEENALAAALQEAREELDAGTRPRMTQNIKLIDAEIARLEKLKTPFGYSSPGAAGIPTGQVAQINREQEILKKQRARLVEREGKRLDPDARRDMEQRVARLEELLAGKDAEKAELERQRAEDQAAARREKKAIEDELEFLRRKNALEGTKRGLDAEQNIRRATQGADFRARADAAQPISSALISGGAQLGNAIQEQTTDLQETIDDVLKAAKANAGATSSLAQTAQQLVNQMAAIEGNVAQLKAQLKNNRN